MIHTRNETDAVKYQVVLLAFFSVLFLPKNATGRYRGVGATLVGQLGKTSPATGNGTISWSLVWWCLVLCHCQVPKAKELFDKASGILGYDLLDKCQNGPKDALDSTVSHA